MWIGGALLAAEAKGTLRVRVVGRGRAEYSIVKDPGGQGAIGLGKHDAQTETRITGEGCGLRFFVLEKCFSFNQLEARNKFRKAVTVSFQGQ